MEREDLSKLPTGWVETRLGNIVHPSDEKVEPSILQEVPYVGLEHIEKTTGKLLEFGNSSEVKSTKSKFYSGDLLYGKLRPYLNKVHCANFEGVCSTDILVFPKQPYISNEFLSYRFLCKDFVSYASQNVNGVQHPRVNFQSLSKFPIALPPLNEQRRIVAKIQALKARSQRVKEALEAIPPLLDQFRQSVLAAAFRGDLTADWREKNPDVESAIKLLERIKLKRFELAKTPRAFSKVQKTYEEGLQRLDFDYINLPETWLLCTVNSIGNVCNGSTPSRQKPEYWNGFIPWVSSGEVCNNIITQTRETITETGYKNSSVNLLPIGTVLLAMIGEGKTRGQTAILKLEATINQNIAAIILEHGLISSEYVWYWFQYQYASTREIGSGSGPQALNCQRVREMLFVLPPLLEQQEIVNCIKNLLKSSKQVEQQYQEVKAYIDQLDQSILAKAFRGELVPQDPNDEPASVLLERIRAERAKQEAAAKTAKKTTAKTTGQRRKKAQQQDSEPVQLELPGLE